MSLRAVTKIKDLKNKKVILRCDFNVPLINKHIEDDFKILQSIATINYLTKQGARVIILSHLGRPEGVYDSTLSLRPVHAYLEKKLRKTILFVDVLKLKDSWNAAERMVNELKPGEIALLENIRFFAGEEKNSAAFAKQLARLGEFFVLDGFGVAHRSAVSVNGIAKYLPHAAGMLLAEEIEALSVVIKKPRRPFVLILGGVKLETKIPVIDYLVSKADYILLGGGIANTYLWAKGYKVGESLIEKKFRSKMLGYIKNKKIIAPHDVVVGTKAGKKVRIVGVDNLLLRSGEEGIFDVGPETLLKYGEIIKQAGSVVWNGALGYFEQPAYETGTFTLARIIANNSQVFRVCGGGETVEVLKKLRLDKKIDFISTGGGAMLEFLSGKILPGIKSVV
jgi:phosphoglycerate kinase